MAFVHFDLAIRRILTNWKLTGQNLFPYKQQNYKTEMLDSILKEPSLGLLHAIRYASKECDLASRDSMESLELSHIGSSRLPRRCSIKLKPVMIANL